jgi:hypothetical protein
MFRTVRTVRTVEYKLAGSAVLFLPTEKGMHVLLEERSIQSWRKEVSSLVETWKQPSGSSGPSDERENPLFFRRISHFRLGLLRGVTVRERSHLALSGTVSVFTNKLGSEWRKCLSDYQGAPLTSRTGSQQWRTAIPA